MGTGGSAMLFQQPIRPQIAMEVLLFERILRDTHVRNTFRFIVSVGVAASAIEPRNPLYFSLNRLRPGLRTDPSSQHLPKAAPSVAWRVRATRINSRNQPEYKASRGFPTEKEAEDYVLTFVEGAFVFKSVVV